MNKDQSKFVGYTIEGFESNRRNMQFQQNLRGSSDGTAVGAVTALEVGELSVVEVREGRSCEIATVSCAGYEVTDVLLILSRRPKFLE